MLGLIRRAGIFLIIAQTMYHFVSGSKYAHYVRLLIRIMVLAILVVPILNFIREGTDENYYEKLELFEKQYEALLGDVQTSEGGAVEEQVLQVTGEEIKETLTPFVSEYGYVISDVKIKSELISFVLRPAGSEKGIVIAPIEKIDLSGEREESAREREFAKALAGRLGMEEEWVEVEIRE